MHLLQYKIQTTWFLKDVGREAGIYDIAQVVFILRMTGRVLPLHPLKGQLGCSYCRLANLGVYTHWAEMVPKNQQRDHRRSNLFPEESGKVQNAHSPSPGIDLAKIPIIWYMLVSYVNVIFFFSWSSHKAETHRHKVGCRCIRSRQKAFFKSIATIAQ